MQSTKLVARVLYFISLFLGLGYWITVLYSVFCIGFGVWVEPYKNGEFLHILYPFTERPFLNVDNNASYIIFSFLLPLSLYGTFFWLAARVFKVFFQSKFFTKENISRLKRFYMLNVFVPLPATALASLFVPVEGLVMGLVMVHLFLGAFTFFLAAIFTQGVNLQNEQDLFI